MPIYEFYCPQTHKIYSFFARSVTYASKTPRCPENPEFEMQKLISSFSVTGRAKEEKAGLRGEDATDDPRMEGAMAEMEREFSGMNDENPDPRQLARMMRKSSDFTGEKMPAQMQEMLQRLEKGEDPDKLEAEYGESLEEPEGLPGAPESRGESARQTLRKMRRRILQRDPTLYEMADFVD